MQREGFIDLEKAFDKTYREPIGRIQQERKVDPKLRQGI